MDVKPSSESLQSFPDSTLPQTPSPNNRWTIILAIGLLIIGGVGAYFLINRNSKTSQNTENIPPLTPVVNKSLIQPQDDNQKIKNYTLRDVKNASLYTVFHLESRKYYIEDRSIVLKDGTASFFYCDSNQTEYQTACDVGSEIKKGILTLSNITASQASSSLPLYDGAKADGATILNFDFGAGNKESYLGIFTLSNYKNENKLYFYNLKNLGVLTGKIQNVDIANNGEINITLITQSGLLNRSFEISSGRGVPNTFIEFTPDKTKKIYDNHAFGYSFNYPKELNISSEQNLRAYVMEDDLKTSPIYYAEECGLKPTFADNEELLYGADLDARLTAHKIDSPAVYLTSALYGYDPADWNKIKQKISIQDYVNDMKSGASIAGRKVSLENIQGYNVRHIAPFNLGRPCDAQYKEQYQWVVGNLLFNLIFTDDTLEPASSNIPKSGLINSIFSSLKVK